MERNCVILDNSKPTIKVGQMYESEYGDIYMVTSDSAGRYNLTCLDSGESFNDKDCKTIKDIFEDSYNEFKCIGFREILVK